MVVEVVVEVVVEEHPLQFLLEVPEVLYNGNHKLIHLWQYENSLRLTKQRRPDLFEEYVRSEKSLTKDEKKILDTVLSEY